MVLSNSSLERLRKVNDYYCHVWSAASEVNTVADEIIETPEKYLLTQQELIQAEGGNSGIALQYLGFALGVGAVFLSSGKIGTRYTHGQLLWKDFLCLAGAGSLGYLGARSISVNSLGNPKAYRNHWMAYSYVKSLNRWEGRNILGKAPIAY